MERQKLEEKRKAEIVYLGRMTHQYHKEQDEAEEKREDLEARLRELEYEESQALQNLHQTVR